MIPSFPSSLSAVDGSEALVTKFASSVVLDGAVIRRCHNPVLDFASAQVMVFSTLCSILCYVCLVLQLPSLSLHPWAVHQHTIFGPTAFVLPGQSGRALVDITFGPGQELGGKDCLRWSLAFSFSLLLGGHRFMAMVIELVKLATLVLDLERLK
jgi:hypothetical protein